MQNFNKFNDSDYISDAPDKLNYNFQTIASDFAGTSFPTTDLVEGMTCYRTDEGKVYRYRGNSWQLEYTIVDGGTKVKQADSASSATSAGKATNDANGKAITGYVADVTVGSSQGKIKVTDGAGNETEFTSYTISTQAEAEAGTDNTKVMTPLRVEQRLTQDVDGVDMNTIKQSGWYRGYSMENSANKAISAFETIAYSPDWVVQKQYCMTDGFEYTRYWILGKTWGEWKKTAFYGALSMPSENRIVINIAGSGHRYTAPCDGWLSAKLTPNSNNASSYLRLNSLGNSFGVGGVGNNVQPLMATIPLAKGQSGYITFSANTSAVVAEFHYAQSEA